MITRDTYDPITSPNSYLLVILSSNFFFPKRGILQWQKHELIEGQSYSRGFTQSCNSFEISRQESKAQQ